MFSALKNTVKSYFSIETYKTRYDKAEFIWNTVEYPFYYTDIDKAIQNTNDDEEKQLLSDFRNFKRYGGWPVIDYDRTPYTYELKNIYIYTPTREFTTFNKFISLEEQDKIMDDPNTSVIADVIKTQEFEDRLKSDRKEAENLCQWMQQRH